MYKLYFNYVIQISNKYYPENNYLLKMYVIQSLIINIVIIYDLWIQLESINEINFK